MILWLAMAPIMLIVGVIFCIRHYQSQLATLTLRDARMLMDVPPTPIAEIQRSGLVKIVGTTRGPHTVMSYFDRVPCLAHRMVTTTYEGATRVGNMVQHNYRISREWQLFPFEIDDGTGVVRIDPRGAVIDYEVAHRDEDSSVQEHLVRMGDRVAIVGHVEVTPTGTYRDGATLDAERVRFVAPPVISWRSDPEFFPKLRPPVIPVSLILGGVGALASAVVTGVDLALALGLLVGVPVVALFVAAPIMARIR